MKKWATATAVYGSEDHLKLMNDGWEPFSTMATPAGQNPITREIEMQVWVFFKKEKTDGILETR